MRAGDQPQAREQRVGLSKGPEAVREAPAEGKVESGPWDPRAEIPC